MSRIFLSHASVDARAAVALKRWLTEQRPQLANEIFLDIDPESGLQLGARWKGQLFRSNSRCEAVICLISRSWAASHECKTEYRTAENLGKQILCVRLEDGGDEDITSEWQRCDLFADGARTEIPVPDGPPLRFSTMALDQVRRAIEGTGVGPENFVWPPAEDPRRAPYRGWEPYEDIDAGVFFGRDAAIVRGLDELRAMRLSGVKSLFVVLGPSGSGKSSFLRAGLIPRLQREDRRFHVLGVMRPERDALTGERGLATAIHTARKTLKLGGATLGEVKHACANDPDRVVDLLVELRAAARERLAEVGQQGSAPTLVLPLDQAEELFTADAGDPADRFLALLAELMGRLNASELGLIVAATIRTDSYEVMQSHPVLGEIPAQLFDELKPMPPSQFKEVITGPAGRTEQSHQRVQFAPDLVERLLADAADGADTLPLLSLTLARLYTDWVDEGTDELTVAHYESMGGMRDVVNNEIEQVLSHHPGDRHTALKLLRAAFIPWLATISRAGDQPARRVARYADLPEASRPLIDALVAKRLMIRDTRAGEVVVEVALESLLRQWDELAGWLRDERQNLIVADDVERNANAWASHSRDPAWLLIGTRLADAEKLFQTAEFGDRLESAGDYLAASRAAEDDRRDVELRHAEERRQTAEAHAATMRRRARVLAAVALVAVVGLVAAGVSLVLANSAKREAFDNFVAATALRLNAEAAEMLSGANLGGDARAFQQLLAARELGTSDEGAMLSAVALRTTTLKIVNPGAALTTVVFSPDNDRLATAGEDGTVRLWDAHTGAPVGDPLTGHTGWVLEVAFSPDGRWLASAGADNTLRLWNTETGEPGRVLTGPDDQVLAVAFSRSNRLAIAGDDGSVQLWDYDTGQPLGSPLTGHSAAVLALAFSPDGNRLATAGADDTVRLWDIGGNRPPRVLTGHTDTVQAVAFSPAGDRLASAGLDGTVRLWSTETDQPAIVFTAHTRAVNDVAFSPDGRLATAGDDNTVRLWNTETGTSASVLSGHTNHVRDVAFSADGKRLASASYDNTVRLWNTDTDQPPAVLTGHDGPVRGVAFSPDGHRLASADSDGTVRLWNADADRPPRILTGHSGRVWGVAFSRSGNRLATAGNDTTVRLWNAETGEPAGELLGHRGAVFAVAFSPDGRRLASASSDGTVRLWDVENRQQIGQPMTGPAGVANSVAFSPDGNLLATAGSDDTVQLWDTETGQPLGGPLTGHTDVVRGVAFSPDGDRLATASYDKAVRLWNVDTGEPVAVLSGHTQQVIAVAFSPDGHRLASASSDQTVGLWNADTGQSLGALTGHTGAATSVAFSPDGDRLASASYDGTVRIWPAVAAPDMLCDKLTADLGRAQWQEWVSPDIPYRKLCPDLPDE